MIELLHQYKKSLRELKEVKKGYKAIEEKKITPQDLDDISTINSMISDLEFAIEWIENGRQPGAKRGLDRREVYKRMVYYDPNILEILGDITVEEENTYELSEANRERIEDALSVLTSREKDVYLMHHVQSFSIAYIAELMGVKKSTIQTHLKRANNKIERRTTESLFCL